MRKEDQVYPPLFLYGYLENGSLFHGITEWLILEGLKDHQVY